MRNILTFWAWIVSISLGIAQDRADSVLRFKSNYQYNIPIPEPNTNTLFYIQKSSNPNTVMYEANRLGTDNLDPDNPVKVFWIRYQEDSTTTDLSFIQRRFAYGVNFEKSADSAGYSIHLVSYKKRKILIFKNSDGEIQANMEINGKISRFKSVFLNVKKDLFIPEIDYIDVFGEDLDTGKEVHERIIP